MENRPERIPLIVRAIDQVIADVEGHTYPERDEQLELLHSLRSRFSAEEAASSTP